jgi:MFS transporter, MHS family, alpha-ketoglutarate permease
MQKFLKLSVSLTDDQTTIVSPCSLIFAMALQPINFRPDRAQMATQHLASGQRTVCGFLLIAAAWMIVSGYTSNCGEDGTVSDEYPHHRRGPSLPDHGVDLRGTAESMALWLKSIGKENWF